tara:strand:- start:664 stop:1137 length:474 start_codon:yes stop_codon:yes gene_type:complete
MYSLGLKNICEKFRFCEVVRIWFVFGLIISFGYGQEKDTLQIRTPQKAAYYALLCPGAGQLYNKKYLKAGILFGAEIYAGIKFNEYRVNYRYYNDDLAFSRYQYLEKRNKSAWWIGFIYIYGLIDAIVDAHLHSFDKIMSEDLERSPVENTKQEEEQ